MRLPSADALAWRPLRIMFAGRIEEDKGVFAILTICARRDFGTIGCRRLSVRCQSCSAWQNGTRFAC
jgi:hypothetical protein